MSREEKLLPDLSIQSLYSIIGHNLPVGIFCSEGEMIRYRNSTFECFFGLSADLAPPLSALFKSPKIAAILKSEPVSGPIVKDELIVCERMNGETFWCSLTLSGIENQGKIFFSGALVDRTSQVNTENLLRKKNDDLKKLNQQLDRFLYSASHDVRQPLTSMMGLIRLMRMEKVGVTEADYLGKLESSVNKLDQFLSQIMEFSKNSHERVSSEHIHFDSLFAKVVGKFETQLGRKKIAVTTTINKGNVFYSDASRISLALYHVIKNCIDYVDSCKGDSFVRLISTCYEDRAVIEVIDNGIGIAKSHLDKVTEMFYRGTDRSKGSGIGLYLVNEIVLKLQGRICIDSELSLGTIVRIELPNGVKGALINRKKNLLTADSPPKRGK